MQSILTIIHVLAACALIGLVLLQHGKGADAGAAFGSGSAGSVFGARGPATFLTRTTAVLAVTFFITSMSLAFLSGQRVERTSVVERVVPESRPESAIPADVPAGAVGSDFPPAGGDADSPADVPGVPGGSGEPR